MKEVLFINGGFAKSGAAIVTLNLAQTLANYYKVSLLAHKHQIEYQIPAHLNMITSDRQEVSGFKKILSKLKFIYYVHKEIQHADLIITEESPSIVIITMLVNLINNKPWVIWNHSCWGEFYKTSLLYNYGFKRANKIVNVSNYAARCLNKLSKQLTTFSHVIYNSVSFKNVVIENNNYSKLKIIAIGSITPNKNFGLLVDSVKYIQDKYNIELYLNIIGSGNDLERQQLKIEELQLNKNISLLGYVENPYDYIRSSGMLISSSNSEALPTVVIEALACEVPVIATNTGAAEILEYGKYGIVVEKNDVTQMANAILEVLNNYEIAKNKAKLGRESLSRFSPEKIVPQWIELIESLT